MEKIWKSEEEIIRAIQALDYRIGCLQNESLTRDIQAGRPNVAVQESAFSHTIRQVFGPDSPEFSDYGGATMLRGPLWRGMPPEEVAKARLSGREYMVMVCVELIGRLHEEIRKLRSTKPSARSTLISAPSLHPEILKASQALLSSGHAWEAVFAAGKALVLHVKKKANRTDLDGVPLMRTVFSKNAPILKFNTQATQVDLDEQEGMMHLFEGAVMALRNPGGHGFPTGPEDRAVQYIQFLSLLAHRAEEASL